MQGYALRIPDTASRSSPSGCTSSSAAATRSTRRSSRRPTATSPRSEQQFVPGDRDEGAAAARVLPRVRPGVLHRRTAQGGGGHDASSCRAAVRHDGRRRRATRASSTSSSDEPVARRPRGDARARARRLARAARRTAMRVKSSYRKDVPRPIARRPGRARWPRTACGCHWVPAPFRFCLRCGVAYGGRQTARLRQAGDARRRAAARARRRSSASPRSAALRATTTLEARGAQAAQLHRQPAGRLAPGRPLQRLRRGRPAPLRALPGGGTRPAQTGSRTTSSRSKVFDALDLPLELYADRPERALRARARTPTARCATSSATASTATWSAAGGSRRRTSSRAGCSRSTTRRSTSSARPRTSGQATPPGARARATPEQREQIATRAARLHAARARDQGRLPATRLAGGAQAALEPAPRRARGRSTRTSSSSHARVALSRSRDGGRARLPRQRLRRPRAAGSASSCAGRRRSRRHRRALTLDDTEQVIRDLLEALRVGGLVVSRRRADRGERRARLPARRLGACAGAPATARAPTTTRSASRSCPTDGGRTNPFFVDFYRASPPTGRASRRASTPPRCRPTSARSARSEFRDGEAAVLFCSPTMELGVDIAELNVVNMRNVPPTPANYAQRSGPRRPQRPAGARLHLLRRRQLARPVLLPPAAS